MPNVGGGEKKTGGEKRQIGGEKLDGERCNPGTGEIAAIVDPLHPLHPPPPHPNVRLHPSLNQDQGNEMPSATQSSRAMVA